MWAPGLRLPTHTAQIHKSLSWLSDGAKRGSVSSVQVKKKLRWWGHRTDNECFWNLSKGPLSLDDSAPTWLDFDIYKRKARPFLQSQGTMIWSQSWHTWPDSEPPTCSLTRWEYPDLSPLPNEMWHHIVKTLSRTAAWKEAWPGGRQRWKEAPGCHSDSIVDFFFQDPTCPVVAGHQPCLHMRVW